MLFAHNISEKKIISGHVPAAIFQCILNVLNHGFLMLIGTKIKIKFCSLGVVPNANFSTMNLCLNIIAIVGNF